MSDTVFFEGKARRILLVDDAGAVTDALRSVFKPGGHDIEVARDGQEALDKYQPGKFDLIITDYQMPRMSGLELSEIIRHHDPEQRILLVTAFAFSIAAHDNAAPPVNAILRKPFSVSDLQQSVRALCRPGPPGATCA